MNAYNVLWGDRQQAALNQTLTRNTYNTGFYVGNTVGAIALALRIFRQAGANGSGTAVIDGIYVRPMTLSQGADNWRSLWQVYLASANNPPFKLNPISPPIASSGGTVADYASPIIIPVTQLIEVPCPYTALSLSIHVDNTGTADLDRTNIDVWPIFRGQIDPSYMPDFTAY